MKIRIYTANGNIDFENADWYGCEESFVVYRFGEKNEVIGNFVRTNVYGIATVEE